MQAAPVQAAIWLVFSDSLTDAALLAAYAELLTPDERARRQRFRFIKHQRQYLITRALLRTTLSRYEPRPPQAWRFITNSRGRPELIPAQAQSGLRFNLSHTEGLIACAVTRHRAIGVDVENSTRCARTGAIAERFFSALECQALCALPPEQQPDRFFDYWTLKEAYIKARGLGLALPLGQFSLLIEPDNPIGIRFGEGIQDTPQRWRFQLQRPSAHHRLALCVETHGAALRVTVHRAVPLSSGLSPTALTR